jgi:arylsulfatase
VQSPATAPSSSSPTVQVWAREAHVLSVDGKEVARNTMDHTTPITFPEDESFDVGLDTRTLVALLDYRYDVPFKFTGKIDKLTFNLEPGQKAEAKP